MQIFEVQAKYPGCSTFVFGDSMELSDWLLSLVRTGKKTATCEALQAYQAEGESMPVVGRIDIALNCDGAPALAVRTVSVKIERFCDVDEIFALAEGENEDLEGWRADHRKYFERGGRFSREMELVCERFELVEDFE